MKMFLLTLTKEAQRGTIKSYHRPKVSFSMINHDNMGKKRSNDTEKPSLAKEGSYS